MRQKVKHEIASFFKIKIETPCKEGRAERRLTFIIELKLKVRFIVLKLT